MGGWGQMVRRVVALVAAMALALQLALPMPQPAAAPMDAMAICHSAPSSPHHDSKHGAPSRQAGCDWCVLCGKLGTAVGPLDRIAALPQRVEAPVVVFDVTADIVHYIDRPRTGPLGARAPPEIA